MDEPNARSFSQGSIAVTIGRPWREVLPELLAARGLRRVLVLSSGRHDLGAELAAVLEGEGLAVARFAESAQHVPRALAERAAAAAADHRADALVALGGGSVIGLAKAVALLRARAGAPVPARIDLPTTYAGSEMTTIWGMGRPEPEPGKEVGRDELVRASAVIYDPALSSSLPARIAIPSLFNAMAHAVDALYGASRDEDALHQDAQAAITDLAGGILDLASEDAAVRDSARLRALHGSQRAGGILDRAGMSLHHKLAHVLGGGYGLDHAGTHATLLPHVVAFMAADAPRATQTLSAGLIAAGVMAAGGDPAAALFDLQVQVDAPRELLSLGFHPERATDNDSDSDSDSDSDNDLVGAAVEEIIRAKIDSPRALAGASEALRELVLDAWLGRRPGVPGRRRLLPAAEPGALGHAGLRPAVAGTPLDQARALVLCVHGRGSTAEAMLAKLEELLGGALPPGLAAVALQAWGRRWYPRSFTRPVADNQPELDAALAGLARMRRELGEQLSPAQVLLFGFSQGACLVLDHLAREGGAHGGAAAFAGALIGERPVDAWHDAARDPRAPVIVGIADADEWVPRARVAASADHLEAQGASVRRIWAAGSEHEITGEQGEALRERIAALLSTTSPTTNPTSSSQSS
ncbi:iron-containing alcohol dehydrogenase [Pseudenhygromyxa sp. WMMC2535]|uniref:iron-containing alcohol dehydrogenase n=1 Tax=Pseudenhygromyxa sp. WMMC2535 TaxID=2712867 RepID=UPI0015556665|nr:iron-containing alcohol dehydrogenase [Pseudenhygromyxa sp. WMMC2535]NVB38525.1 iron-containing alcohol dehydrogenase [Pseudenhygromyxa sp. WMMC2535]